MKALAMRKWPEAVWRMRERERERADRNEEETTIGSNFKFQMPMKNPS